VRRVLLAGAVGVVLAVNSWAVFQAWHNQQVPKGGALELTDRELHLLPLAAESTVTLLRLNWEVGGADGEPPRSPEWLDRKRLTELGFDCSVALNSPSARRHYASMPSRPAYLVLEYQGEAWRNAGPKAQARTGLSVVDAARDASQLRERYPDAQRHIICRGLVRLSFRDHDRKGAPLSAPRIEGWVQTLRPAEIFVPLPHNRILAKQSRPNFEAPPDAPRKEPRFLARVCWGANYEPWVEAIRLSNAAELEAKKP
jgi:hypothetical protein